MEKDVYVKIGERLRKQRRIMGLTQEQAAELLGVSTTYYGEIERGNRKLTIPRILTVYEKMNLEPTYLLTGEILTDKVYDEILVPAGMGDVAIYTEMGRFMLAPYGCLVTQAIHEKHTHKEYIGVDACAVNLMRPAMYGAYHHITVLGKDNSVCDHKYDVTGSLCENNDKFAVDRMLPKIDMGDYLVIHDTGAHGYSMGYNYNGKLKSAELLLKEDGSVQLIRRAETPKDYFATFDCFDILKNMKDPEK